jgi:exodeoxyribonuclease-3
MIKIATWNINSIRQRLEHLTSWLDHTQTDIVLLQETKVTDDKFPTEPLEERGYNLAFTGQKTFNGVAILSKYPLEDVITTLPGQEEDEQKRYIEAVVSLPDSSIARVASIYVPNGQSPDSEKFPYKMGFLNNLRAHAQTLLGYEETLILGGDYNIAPEAIDVHEPRKWEGQVCFHPREREHFRALTHLGLYDAFRIANPEREQYSWWDYRGGAYQKNDGLRIDHLLLSPQAVDRLQGCEIDESLRGLEKPSDHTPVVVVIGN